MDAVKTGDILLFSSNTPTGFLLRTAISSDWNHIGIAVRYVLKNGTPEIVEGITGTLCVFETNACERYDHFIGKDIIGAGFSSMDHIIHKYNRIDARIIRPEVIPEHFATRLARFTKKYRGSRFPSSSKPFLSVWLGVDLFPKSDPDKENMFCSELVAQYVLECFCENLFEEYSGDLSRVLGQKLPVNANMYTPAHFDINISEAGKILAEQRTIFTKPADLLYIILTPLILICFVIMCLSARFTLK